MRGFEEQPTADETAEDEPLLDGTSRSSSIGPVSAASRSRNLILRVGNALLRELRPGLVARFLTAVVIITVLIVISINLQFADRPNEYDDQSVAFDFATNFSAIQDLEIWDQSYSIDDSFKIETHSHSTRSDGNMNPTQLIAWAHAYGFNALFLSDHNTLSGTTEVQALADRLNILVIPAIEYSCCRIHMNLINVTDTTGLQPVTWPTDEEIQRIIDLTHARGGYVIVNHLPWSQNIEYSYQIPTLPDHPTVAQLLDWHVDGFEGVHGNVIDLRILRLNKRLEKTREQFVVVASNDVHYATQPPNCWTLLSRSSLMQKSNKITVDDVLDEIFGKKKSTFMYSATGAPGRAYPALRTGWLEYAWFAPFTSLQFGWLFTERRGMYSFTGEFCHEKQFEVHVKRAVWFIVWCLCAFAAHEVVRASVIVLGAGFKTRTKHAERYAME